MRPEVRMECDALSKAPAMASATYHSNSKARLISAVTEDVLGGTLTESYTYNFPGGVTIDYNYLNLTRKISGKIFLSCERKQDRSGEWKWCGSCVPWLIDIQEGVWWNPDV